MLVVSEMERLFLWLNIAIFGVRGSIRGVLHGNKLNLCTIILKHSADEHHSIYRDKPR